MCVWGYRVYRPANKTTPGEWGENEAPKDKTRQQTKTGTYILVRNTKLHVFRMVRISRRPGRTGQARKLFYRARNYAG